MEKALSAAVYKQLRRLVANVNYRMQEQAQQGKVYLSAPALFLRLFQIGLTEERKSLLLYSEDWVQSGWMVYEGIRFIPHAEWSVIVFHESYPEYKEDWMMEQYKIKGIPNKPSLSIEDISTDQLICFRSTATWGLEHDIFIRKNKNEKTTTSK